MSAILIRASYPEPRFAFIGPGDAMPTAPPVGEPVEPADGTAFKLEEVQALVGGYVQVSPLADGRIMILNENGLLLRLPVNVEATILFRQGRAPIDTIVGDVVVCAEEQFE